MENKLTSIDPVVLQEYEFLKNFIARVVTLKPNIVLVEKTVARVAQDMILAAGITLVHNIKSVRKFHSIYEFLAGQMLNTFNLFGGV